MPAIGSFKLNYRWTGLMSDQESEVATATERKYFSAAFHTFHCVDITAFGFLLGVAIVGSPHTH